MLTAALFRERGLGYFVVFLYSIVVAVLWIPVFLLHQGARLLREIGVESWPRAEGSITSGEVRATHGWILDYAVGQLAYSYHVRGEYYAGSITRQYADEQAAWDFVDARRGKSALIRYKDDKPQVSVFLETDQGLLWNPEPSPAFFTQLWRHWSDELRREPTGNDAPEANDDDYEPISEPER